MDSDAAKTTRLDLSQRDGAAWFSARASCEIGHRQILSQRSRPHYDVLNNQFYLLIGSIFCLEPALLDFIVIYLACGFVRYDANGPWTASQKAITLLLEAVGKKSNYQEYLQYCLLRRYYSSGTVSQTLELAVYQQLQMPFAYHGNYLAPLHVFPLLECGSFARVGPSIQFRCKLEYVEAQAIVWLRILERDDTVQMINTFYNLGPLHRLCADEYVADWRKTFAQLLRNVVDKYMEYYRAQLLRNVVDNYMEHYRRRIRQTHRDRQHISVVNK